MPRTAVIASSIALAFLAGCASESKVTPAPAPVVVTPAPVAPAVVVPQANGQAVVVPQPSASAAVVVPPTPGPLRAGFAHVETITPIPVAAAGGGTVNSGNRRIGLRMEDGSMQYVDSTASPLSVGDRVEITSDGKMRFPVP